MVFERSRLNTMNELQSAMSRFNSDPAFSLVPGASNFVTDLRTRLLSESEKNQLQLIRELTEGNVTIDGAVVEVPPDQALTVLMEFLLERRSQAVGAAEGSAYQAIWAAESPQIQEFLKANFPAGLVPLQSDRAVDYSSLQDLLVQQDFQAADRVTLQKLCELAGATAVQRKWLYFTEVESFPVADLQTIDTLWRVYSEGKFGFSVQREIWLGVGKNWEKLWPKIAWKAGNNWTRYPQEFIWSQKSAPRGHLPLSNQLRGVRVLASLFAHPAWDQTA